MHRNYQVHQPIQIIRYANRIEIRNPGYSLISDEYLGEAGSKTRNPKIAQVLYDTDFAEMKGSGIRIMREKMEAAGLSPPIFESARNRDLFIVTFLFHHFLGEADLEWLKYFKKFKLSNEQAKAVIFVREVGAINNSDYRTLNHVDTLTASSSLRQLKEMELLIAKNQGSATYYTPGSHFMASLSQSTGGHMPLHKGHMPLHKGHMPLAEEQALNKTMQTSSITGELPSALRVMIEKLGKRAKTEVMEQTILKLCSWKALSSAELSQILQRIKLHLFCKCG